MASLQSFSCRPLLPGLLGLLCCACSATPSFLQSFERSTLADAPVPSEGNRADLERLDLDRSDFANSDSDGVAVETLQPADASAVESPVQSPSAPPAAYREGINLASSAYILSQSAVSPDDWGLIASRWQRAADQLKTVPKSDTHYSIAQQKATEYSLNVAQATTKIEDLQRSVQTPLRISRAPGRSQPVLQRAPIDSQRLTPAAAFTGSDMIRVPVIRRLHGTPVVRVEFNGQKTYDMILDTGASRTLITRQMADELGIVTTEKMIATTASEAEVTFDIGMMRSIAIGSVILRDARVGIGEAVSIGLLGNDFLNGYDVTIRDRDNVVELVASQ